MLGIKTKLLTVFHPQTDGYTEQINQKLEQYLQFFVDHRQKNWPEWLVLAEFAVNIKVYSTIKVSPFMVNFGRELRMETNIRKNRKIKKVTEFVERMMKVQEKVRVALRKAQKEMKRKEVEEWKKEDKVILSTKDLVFKKRLAKKLVDPYMGPYLIDEVVSTNAVKL